MQLAAQVNPPSLRCLQVLPNGDVKLTWISPSDPNGNCSSYEVWSANFSSGPFTLVGTIGALATTQYTHTGAGANTHSCYYYMKTKFNANNSFQNSDTLRTIFLNCIQNSGSYAVKLIYNNIHQPGLPSTAPNFLLTKEFPSTIWNNMASTPALNYYDTISVCSASINYQATLQDVSGCYSSSNIQGGLYKDQKPPNQPFVDSVSVLPSGNTIIAWHIPRDADVIGYQIAKNTGTSNIVVAITPTITGINNTSFVYTVNVSNSNWVGMYVSAIDSCKNISTYDSLPRTMHLITKYDSCSYKTNLLWTPYRNMPKGLLEYRIYYSFNGSAFLQVGSTTLTAFTHTNTLPSANCCYFIRAVNNDKTITSSSNRSCFFSQQLLAPGFIYIQTATVVDKSTNRIKIFLDTTKVSKGITLYRSLDAINYSNIANVAFNGTPFYEVLDDNADTKHNFYYYKAVVNDGCGNERTQSQITKTMLLKVLEDKEEIFTKHLSWNNYLGFNGGVSGYNIYRVVNDVQNATPVSTKGPTDTTFTDDVNEEAPNGSKIEYVVEAVEGIGDSYGFAETSKSNMEDVYIEGRMFIPTAFAPNGKNKIWLPITHFIDKADYNVSIFNRWGTKLFETNDATKGWDGKNALPDVYVYLINYKNSRGEYQQLKGTLILLQ
jgi:gliding motility-associated-like protein